MMKRHSDVIFAQCIVSVLRDRGEGSSDAATPKTFQGGRDGVDDSRLQLTELGSPLRRKRLKLKAKDIDNPFSIDFDGQGIVDVDENGLITASAFPFVVEKPGKEVTLTLPLPLLDTTVITISGGLSKTLLVADDLKT